MSDQKTLSEQLLPLSIASEPLPLELEILGSLVRCKYCHSIVHIAAPGNKEDKGYGSEMVLALFEAEVVEEKKGCGQAHDPCKAAIGHFRAG